MDEFEKKFPTIMAIALTKTLTELRRDGVPIENLIDGHFYEIFMLVRAKIIIPEAIREWFIYFANNPAATLDDAISDIGVAGVEHSIVEEIIKRIVTEQTDYIKSRGEDSINGLMGIAMKELRGKVDGKTVRDLLLSEVQNIINKGK